MAPATTTGGTAASHVHAVVIPYPGRGHLNPMMNLCKLLAASFPELRITFVVTEEWLGLIGSDDKPEQVRFATIPNVLPSEKNRGSDMAGFIAATQTKMEEPFELLLSRLGDRAHVIISDAFLIWTVGVGNRRNIPVALLWPMPASVFSIFHNFDLLLEKGYKPGKISESGETTVDCFPGIPSIRLRDLPSILQSEDQTLAESVLKIRRHVSNASYLIFSSIYEVESRVIRELSRGFPFPVATIGTTIPFLDLQRATARFSPDEEDTGDNDYMNWLTSQPPSSVLYVAFGSFLPVSSPQMDAIADGLRRSSVRFLWAARGEAARLREKCGERGRIVPWCEQLKVLSQPSVGGFWSHCGWNSTMEAILCGVPVIAMPLMMDQVTIRKHVVEDWRIGVDATRGVALGEMLRSEAVEELAKEFMDLESPARKEMELRAAELRAAAVEEFSEGGSSRRNLRDLVDYLQSLNVPE